MLHRTETVQAAVSQLKAMSELEWKSFWKDLILKSVGKDFNSFEVLQEYLENQDRRILFIVDGLEELLGKTSESEHEKVAIRALCQGVVNELRSFVDGRIGLIVFLRNDVAMNSIKQNWGQFRAQYTAFELKWTHVLLSWHSCSESL